MDGSSFVNVFTADISYVPASLKLTDNFIFGTADDSGTVHIHSVQDGNCQKQLQGPGDGVTSVDYDDNADILVIGLSERVVVWSASSGTCLRTIETSDFCAGALLIYPSTANLGTPNHYYILVSLSSKVDLYFLDGQSHQILRTETVTDPYELEGFCAESGMISVKTPTTSLVRILLHTFRDESVLMTATLTLPPGNTAVRGRGVLSMSPLHPLTSSYTGLEEKELGDSGFMGTGAAYDIIFSPEYTTETLIRSANDRKKYSYILIIYKK